MMKYIFFCLVLVLLSCEARNNNPEYKIIQTSIDNSQVIKLLDKNNVELFEIKFYEDGTIFRYIITDSRNFSSVFYLNEDGTIVSYNISDKNDFNSAVYLSDYGIDSYKIIDGRYYSNITNFHNYDNTDGIIVTREEQLNKKIFIETIYQNGLIIKEKK